MRSLKNRDELLINLLELIQALQEIRMSWLWLWCPWNYMRSTMSQEKLNGLTILCLEKKLLDKIDIDTIVTDFASKNVRKNF